MTPSVDQGPGHMVQAGYQKGATKFNWSNHEKKYCFNLSFFAVLYSLRLILQTILSQPILSTWPLIVLSYNHASVVMACNKIVIIDNCLTSELCTCSIRDWKHTTGLWMFQRIRSKKLSQTINIWSLGKHQREWNLTVEVTHFHEHGCTYIVVYTYDI